MNGDSRMSGRSGPTGPGDLVRLCERVLSDFIADPERNNLGPGAPAPAWEDFLLGFAAGDDPLWDELKTAVGPDHWTPAEAFAAGSDTSTPLAGAPNAKQPTTPWAALPAAPASAAPERLTVISWAVVQTEATKASNRFEPRMPSESWARARVFGQMANRELHRRCWRLSGPKATRPSPRRWCPRGARSPRGRTTGIPPGPSGTWHMSAASAPSAWREA